MYISWKSLGFLGREIKKNKWINKLMTFIPQQEWHCRVTTYRREHRWSLKVDATGWHTKTSICMYVFFASARMQSSRCGRACMPFCIQVQSSTICVVLHTSVSENVCSCVDICCRLHYLSTILICLTIILSLLHIRGENTRR